MLGSGAIAGFGTAASRVWRTGCARDKGARPGRGVGLAVQPPWAALPCAAVREVNREADARAPRDATSRAEEAARKALAELDRLVALLAQEQGAPLPDDAVVSLPIEVPLARGETGKQAPRGARVEALVADARVRLQEALAGATPFREGHVYCFFTNQPESPYSSPPRPTDVFAGYAASGRPEWVSFANLCLARKEPRVDRLYGDAPEVLALVLGPEDLASGEAELMPSFARGHLLYRVLGQVVLGLVPRDLEPRSRADRVALTIQIVETSQPGLRHRLRLNVIGLAPDEIAAAAADQPETSPAEGFRRVIRAARARVDALGRQAALAHKQRQVLDLEAQVAMQLGRLRGDVLRVLKSRDYRTRHAAERHQSGERPTSLAVADALAATEGRFFRDEHKNTIVVLGPRHRVHVFTQQGKHVTSLELQPAEVERRLDLKRWRFLERVGSELFKDTLRKTLEREDSP